MAGDVNFGDLVGCELDLLRHGGAYARIKDGGSGNGCGRQKRLRTSFKHHQLRSMKAYFALNHNPDAKDLKELAQKTGLTKRVLQVSYSSQLALNAHDTSLQFVQGWSCNHKYVFFSILFVPLPSFPDAKWAHQIQLSDLGAPLATPAWEERHTATSPPGCKLIFDALTAQESVWWLQMLDLYVKRNLKIEANVVVSKRTVYVTT